MVPAVPEPLDRQLNFGPDGALYASGGDGASSNYADYGQADGSAGSPTAKTRVVTLRGAGGTQTAPAAREVHCEQSLRRRPASR